MEGVSTANIYVDRKARRRWENNNRMDLEEVGVNTRSWIDSTQDRDYMDRPC